MRAAGFVLTGGESQRMGRDKALIPVGHTHLVEQIAAVLSTVTESVALVGRPDRYAHLSWPCLPDLHCDTGPLGGIEAALTSERGELNLVLACDMPSLRPGFLQALLQRARTSSAPCIVPEDGEGRVHPLCAVYTQGCLAPISQAIHDRRLKLTVLVQELGAEYFQVEKSQEAASDLANVNTPAEWAQWRQAHSLRE